MDTISMATAILLVINGIVSGLLLGVLVAIKAQPPTRPSRGDLGLGQYRQVPHYQILHLKSPRDVDAVVFPWLRRDWAVVLTMHDERVGRHVVVLEKRV